MMRLNFYTKLISGLISSRKTVALFCSILFSVGFGYSQTAASGIQFSGYTNYDYITVPSSPSLNISKAITLESWIFPTSNGGVQDVISKSSAGLGTGYIFPRTVDGWRNVEFLLYMNYFGWVSLSVPYQADASNLIQLNQWHHLAATYDGTDMKVYIDGILKGSLHFAGSIAVNNNPLTIGSQEGYPDEFYAGKVDEIRIWNRALTQCEIANQMNCELNLAALPPGLAAYYQFNQGILNADNSAITQVTDYSGNGNTADLTGFLGTGFYPSWVAGKVTTGVTCGAVATINATASSTFANIPMGGTIALSASGGTSFSWVGPNGFTSTLQNPTLTGVGMAESGIYTATVTNNGCTGSASSTVTVSAYGTALDFNGNNNFISIPHNTAFVTQKNLSFETWIYPTSSTPAVQNVVSKSSFLVNDGFIFPRTDDGWQNFSFWLAIDGQWKAVTAAFPSLNQWHHVAATYDGFFMKIYLDGVLKSSLAISGNITSNTNDIFIGQQQDQIEYFKGGLDELRIWSRTLTQCEIQNNYTCELNTIGTVTNPNPLAAQIGLLAYYQFNQGLANADNSAVTTSAISTTAINVLTDISGSGNHGSLHNFDLTGTSSNWMVGGTVNGNTCSAFTASTASVTSNGAIVAVGSPIIMSVNGGTAWSWTGPGSPAFTSNQQAINIANAQPVNSGIYTVSVTGSGGCIEDISTSVKVANRAGTLHFDGNNDLVTVPSNASLNIPNTITIESWIYPTDDIRQTQDVMGKSSYDINTGYIFPRTDDGWKSFVFYLHINGAWQKLSAIFPNPALNKWNHLSATYDGFFMRIYLDGVLQASKQVSGNITQNINNLMIGQQPGYNEYFSGQLDEARIWNRALSQCEIINNMGCELANSTVARNGLVAYYQFNQGFIAENNANENTLIDASGNNNTGSLQNFTLSGTASNWSTEYIKGICAAYSDPGVSASANGSIFGIGSTVKLFTNHLVIPSSYSWDGPQGTGFSTIKNPTIINAQTSATGIYTVTANYVNCSVMASTKVSVNALSPIEANGPTTFCPSGSVSLLTPNAGIGYQWYLNDGINGDVMIAGATANTYVAGQSGNYWVTVNNGQNILVSVPITVLVIDNQAPQPVIAQLLPMTLQLPGNNLPAIVSLYPTATDNCRGTITGTTTDALSFTTPGTYSILWKYDDQNGQIVTQLQQINVLKPIDVTPPVLTLPGNIIVPAVLTSCGATVYFTATATDDSGDPVTIAYSLAPGSLFSVGNTTVTVTATDLSSNAATGTFTVAVLPTVVSPVSGNNIICVGAATILTTTTTTGGTWSSNNMAVASVDQSGNVIGLLAGTADIRYTNSCGVFASIPVIVNAIPSAPIVSVTDNCGTSALTASGVTGTLLWSNGGTTPGITVPAGTYTVTQTVNGCVSPSGSGTANPKAIPSAPIVSVTDNCGTSALTASGVTGTLSWSNGVITPSIIVSSGTYTVTQTVNGCVSPSGSGTANPKAIPSAPIVSVTDNCGTATLTASGVTGTLLWSNGGITPSITVPSGTYTVTQTVNGCVSPSGSGTANPKAIPSAPIVSVTDNCGTSTLTASGVTGTLLWSNGGITPSITVPSGTYTVTQTVNGCVSPSGTGTAVSLAIPSTPVITVVNGCGFSTLTASNTTGSLSWSNGSTGTSITVTNAGSYSVTQTVGTCISTAATAIASPIQIPSAPSIVVADNCGTSTLTATGANGASFKWNDIANSTTATITVPVAGTYMVTQTVATCISAAAFGIASPKAVPVTPTITVVNSCGSTLVSTDATGSILWSNNGGTLSSFTATAPGTYTVTSTNANGCSATSGTTSVTINSIPVVAPITGNVSVTTGYTSQLANATAGGVWSSSNSAIASVNASGLVTGVTAGTTDIIYTVTNSTCTTTVTTLITVTFQPICSVLPMATITPSTADVLCNKVTLNGSSSVAGSSYSWMFGANSLGLNPSLTLDLSSADGTYQLYVTANGCTSLVASYQYQKQYLANSYTILAFKEIKLGKNNTVATGSLGVTSTKGVIKLNSNTSIASAGSFVKASAIKKEGSGINIGNPIYSAATGIVLPTMYNNTVNVNSLSGSITVNRNSTRVLTGNYRNLTLKKGSFTTLNGNTFGSIKMEEGAEVIFTAAIINIDKLDVQNGPDNGYSYIRFEQQAKVLVSSGVSIGSKVFINPDNRNVTFYLGDNSPDKEKFTVTGRNTKVNANIYVPDGELKVNGGNGNDEGDNHDGNDDDHSGNHKGNHDDDDNDHHEKHDNSHVYMTGFFIAEKVEAEGKNIIWNSFKCDAASAYSPNSFTVNTVNQTVSQEKMVNIASTEEELKITVMPNPSTTYFTLKFESKYQAPVNLRVMDVNGRVVDAKSKISPNSTIQIGAGYTSGNYFAEMMQGTQRKVIQLIKVRG